MNPFIDPSYLYQFVSYTKMENEILMNYVSFMNLLGMVLKFIRIYIQLLARSWVQQEHLRYRIFYSRLRIRDEGNNSVFCMVVPL